MLQLKPRLFKHKRLIIFGLIITFLNYFVVSYNLFNTSIAIFLLSIAISIILVKDIFLVFLGRKEIKRQMETYILENYDKIGIDNFQTALLENDNIYKTTYLQENLQVVQKIFEKESNSSSVDNKSELLSKIETIISDTFIRIYQKNNSETLITILNYISELYEIANSKEEPVPLSIWDNISREYFKSLRIDLGDNYDDYMNNEQCIKLIPTKDIIDKVKSKRLELLKFRWRRGGALWD